MRHDEQTLRQGRRLLRQMLPIARARARKAAEARGMEKVSGLGATVLPHLSEENLEALLIYPAEQGGWHADLLLRRVPPGVPNTMGTPVSQPAKTREEAEEIALSLLAAVIETAEQRRSGRGKEPPPEPVFALFDLEIRLSSAIYERLLRALPDVQVGYGSEAAACERIAELLDELMPGGFSGEAFDRLEAAEKLRLVSALHIAALSGVHRYPPSRPASPSGHREDARRH